MSQSLDIIANRAGQAVSSVDTGGVDQTLLPHRDSIVSDGINSFFFAEKTDHYDGMTPLNRPLISNDWITLTLLLCLSLLAAVRLFYPKRVNRLFLAIVSRKQMGPLMRAGSAPNEWVTLLVMINYLLVTGIFFLQVLFELEYVRSENTSVLFIFLILLLTIIGLVFIKLMMAWFVGVIFKNRDGTISQWQNMLIFNQGVGLLLLPIVIFNSYIPSQIFLFTGLFILGILNFFRFFRGFIIGLESTKFSWLHIILYLCALEIVPVLIVLKIAYNQFLT